MLRRTFLTAACSIAACAPRMQSGSAPLADIEMDARSGVPLIRARIGASEEIVLLVDTGFDVNVIDQALADRLGLASNAGAIEAAPGGDVNVAAISPVAVHIGELTTDAVPFTGIDMSGLSAFVGAPIAGIIGHDFLARYVVALDYDNARLRICDAATWEYAGAGAILPVTVVNGGEPLVDCDLVLPSGRTITTPYKLDTGSFDVAGLALNFVRDNSVIEPGMPELVVRGVAVGGSTEGRLFRASAFRMGNIVIEQPQLGYTVDSSGFEERPYSGTVGNGAFARGQLILDYTRSRLIVESDYRGRAREEFRFGMLLVSAAPFAAVTVMQVMPNSAAADAGLHEGDVIVSLDGEQPNLADARARLQQPTPVSLTYRRGEQEHTVTITPRALVPELNAAP